MAETLHLQCSRCQAEWDSAAEEPGTFVTCPGCGAATKVPRPEGEKGTGPIPTGGRSICPACGSTKSRPLSDEAVTRFYAGYGRNAPPLILRPRRCQDCRHAWEVDPPRFLLFLGIGMLSVGALVGLAAVVLCVAAVIRTLVNNQADIGQRLIGCIKPIAIAIGGGSMIVACRYGIRYYQQKLRGQRNGQDVRCDPEPPDR